LIQIIANKVEKQSQSITENKYNRSINRKVNFLEA